MVVNPTLQARVETYKKYTKTFLGKRLRWLTNEADQINKGKLLLPNSPQLREQLDLLCAGYKILGCECICECISASDTMILIAFVAYSSRGSELLVYITSIH
jgi:hypothetical protein